MKSFETEQEEFWAAEFGNDYAKRVNSQEIVASNIFFFSKALSCARGIDSAIEFGANIGLNLRAIRQLLPSVSLEAVEINNFAAKEINRYDKDIRVHNDTIFKYVSDEQKDLSLIKGVLIHINPDLLQKVYSILYNSSRKYILVAEYYSPSPVAIKYRGHDNRLFKRDFAGEIMDKYPDLGLVDYGFCYRRDPMFPMDDLNWFLLEKTAS